MQSDTGLSSRNDRPDSHLNHARVVRGTGLSTAPLIRPARAFRPHEAGRLRQPCLEHADDLANGRWRESVEAEQSHGLSAYDGTGVPTRPLPTIKDVGKGLVRMGKDALKPSYPEVEARYPKWPPPSPRIAPKSLYQERLEQRARQEAQQRGARTNSHSTLDLQAQHLESELALKPYRYRTTDLAHKVPMNRASFHRIIKSWILLEEQIYAEEQKQIEIMGDMPTHSGPSRDRRTALLSPISEDNTRRNNIAVPTMQAADDKEHIATLDSHYKTSDGASITSDFALRYHRDVLPPILEASHSSGRTERDLTSQDSVEELPAGEDMVSHNGHILTNNSSSSNGNTPLSERVLFYDDSPLGDSRTGSNASITDKNHVNGEAITKVKVSNKHSASMNDLTLSHDDLSLNDNASNRSSFSHRYDRNTSRSGRITYTTGKATSTRAPSTQDRYRHLRNTYLRHSSSLPPYARFGRRSDGHQEKAKPARSPSIRRRDRGLRASDGSMGIGNGEDGTEGEVPNVPFMPEMKHTDFRYNYDWSLPWWQRYAPWDIIICFLVWFFIVAGILAAIVVRVKLIHRGKKEGELLIGGLNDSRLIGDAAMKGYPGGVGGVRLPTFYSC